MLGLGEAGGRLATDLVALGVEVRGYDPDPARDVPSTATSAPDPAAAAPEATSCSRQQRAGGARRGGRVPASVARGHDLCGSEHRVAGAEARDRHARRRRRGTLRRRRARSGPFRRAELRLPRSHRVRRARAFADMFEPLGMPVEVISDEAGDAAALKLLRSVFMKGLAAGGRREPAGGRALRATPSGWRRRSRR